MPTTELKELCVLAYERQLVALANQGEGGKLVSTLKAEMKEVSSSVSTVVSKLGTNILWLNWIGELINDDKNRKIIKIVEREEKWGKRKY